MILTIDLEILMIPVVFYIFFCVLCMLPYHQQNKIIIIIINIKCIDI